MDDNSDPYLAAHTQSGPKQLLESQAQSILLASVGGTQCNIFSLSNSAKYCRHENIIHTDTNRYVDASSKLEFSCQLC